MNSIVRFLHLDVIFSQRCQYTNPFTVDWIAVTIVYTCTYSKHRTADGEATLIAYGNAGELKVISDTTKVARQTIKIRRYLQFLMTSQRFHIL